MDIDYFREQIEMLLDIVDNMEYFMVDDDFHNIYDLKISEYYLKEFSNAHIILKKLNKDSVQHISMRCDILRDEVYNILQNIIQEIDDDIQIRFMMFYNRLVDKNATFGSIGNLCILPYECILKIATSVKEV
jgi:hypothetical protein